MTTERSTLEAGMQLFVHLVEADPGLREEFEASRRVFFRGAPGEDPAARLRHLEWFLFERGGEAGALQVERLMPAWRAAAGEELSEHAEAFLTTQASIFRVGAVRPDEGVWLADLAGLGEFPVEDPALAELAGEGDLVVGRLFAAGDASYRVSPAAGIFSEPVLAAAVERDLERLRADRVHKVLRVAQIELEAMFFGAGLPAPPPEPVAEARRFFRESGLAAERVEGMLSALAAAPFDPRALVHGSGDRLGELLEQLAFDTDVDLEAARRLLLASWPVLAGAEPRGAADAGPASAASTEAERRAALERFERERRAGVDLERSIAELERSLGLSDADDEAEPGGQDEAVEDEDEDADEAGPVPDFPGVVGAVVEEFLWEVGAGEGAEAARALEPLRRFAGYASDLGVIENLDRARIVAFAALWLPEQAAAGSEELRETMVALRRFVGWLRDEQALALEPGLEDELQTVQADLVRLSAANRELPGAPRGGESSVLEALDAESTGTVTVRGPGGIETAVQVEPQVARVVRGGDWLRFALDGGGRARPVRVYPPQARTWFGPATARA